MKIFVNYSVQIAKNYILWKILLMNVMLRINIFVHHQKTMKKFSSKSFIKNAMHRLTFYGGGVDIDEDYDMTYF